MNKNAIKKFAIEARKKLIDSVTDKAGMLGITEKSCSEPVTKGVDFEVYQTIAGTEVTLNKRQCEQRRRLVAQVEARGFEAVVEEVAYTWFNRICAIRFMEVNDYLPNRVRVLSSEKEGKMEPDIVTQALDVDLDLTAQEKEEIINWKLSGTSEDTDKLYCKLFLKQCHQLHDILPGLFEADSDYMELLFGISYTNKDDVIYMLVNPETGIPEDDFNVSALDEEGNPIGQVEIIGWLYQYYNTELKDDTFAKLKKKVKITKERIPAATQLFTPDWIVRYMVENSVGRIWIEHLRALDPSTDEKATAERFGWKYYLPEAEQEESVNAKLAEIRKTYKDLKPTDITCIDPCMGSGHILIAMFDVLMDIYESAGYDKREAAFEIVEHNIHGLDIDQRAYQLAYFAVMMKGRGYNRRFLRGRDGKPEPKVYAIAESNEINRSHLKFFGTHLSDMERNLAVMQMEGLLDTFIDAREYGSILNVDACNLGVLERFVEDLGTDGQISFESVGSEETQNNLRKLIRIARNLTQKYDAVVTNPPYMGSDNMSKQLDKYCRIYYPDSRYDLYAVFLEKFLDRLKGNATLGMICQHSWMYLRSFKNLRKYVLKYDIMNMVHLGAKAFEEIAGEVVQTTAFIMRNSNVNQYKAKYHRLNEILNPQKKKIAYLTGEDIYYCSKDRFFNIPNYNLGYWISDQMVKTFKECQTIGDISQPRQGLASGNNALFYRFWQEIDFDKFISNAKSKEQVWNMGKKYVPVNKGGGYKKWYGNNYEIIKFDKYNYNKLLKSGNHLPPRDKYFIKGITWGKIASSGFSARYCDTGFVFTDSGMKIVGNDSELKYICAFLHCKVAPEFLKIFSETINYETGNISQLPLICDKKYKDFVINKVEENIEIAKIEWDSFESSWDFKKHPLLQKDATIAKSFVQWQNECNIRFEQLKCNEEDLNRIFIDIYGLQDELTPEVEDKDITVRKANLSRDIRSFISYAVGCMFGRYSLDEEGLIYAGGDFDKYYKKIDEFLGDKNGNILVTSDGKALKAGEKYGKIKTKNGWKDLTFSPDDDNCIPISDEEYFSDDIVSRFVEFVKIVYGPDTLEENLDFIANALGNKGNTSREVIRNYFLKDFYKDHLKVYQKRPIYWLFDSGKQNGFKALIYMHRYDADTVGRVRTDYLHRAQKYVETAMQSAQYTIDNATTASEKSKATRAVTKYTKQLAEMKIYDEAIAHIANQRIEIDLDDGVKVNYAKFQGVEVAQEGKKALTVDLLAKIK